MLKRYLYRLETSNEQGIYTAKSAPNSKLEQVQYRLNSTHNWNYANKRPNFYQDFNGRSGTNVYEKLQDTGFIFGCKSIEDLEEWFDNGLFQELIQTRGVQIVRYETKLYLRGNSRLQYVFDPIPNTRKVLRKAKWKQ